MGKKDDKPSKVMAAGISKAERDELEKLKNDIISRKKELKDSGMSGGQINKDEQVVGWVNRMNELKEKDKGISAEAKAEAHNIEAQIEEYKQKLSNEFKYSKKEIMADPDMMDMQAKLKKLQGKK